MAAPNSAKKIPGPTRESQMLTPPGSTTLPLELVFSGRFMNSR